MRKFGVAAIAALVLLVGAAQAVAVPLVLHNTGEGLSQGDPDPNWTVVLPDGTFFGQAISATDPNGAWITPTAPNSWVSIVGSASILTGTYRYSTTFLIDPGFNPATAILSGFWWSDDPNSANGIYLNGVQVSSFPGAFWFDTDTANAAFSISSGFVSGVNTLTFYVTNTGGPGGTLIQGLTGSVPEPAVVALLGLGLAGIAATRRRKQ